MREIPFFPLDSGLLSGFASDFLPTESGRFSAFFPVDSDRRPTGLTSLL